MINAVVDTNVLLSALKKTSLARKILVALADNKFKLFLSALLREELERTVLRPKIQKLVSDMDGTLLVTIIGKAATIVRPSHPITSCRDPKDNIVLECASAGRVDYIVTGDRDLLTLHPFHGIQIISPSDFLNTLA